MNGIKLKVSRKNSDSTTIRTNIVCPNTSCGLVDRDYGLYNEEYFKEILCTERKRAERSNEPFLLLIINIERIVQAANSKEVVKDLMSVLLPSTRETDLYGWYRYNAEIGIIFTEIDGHDKREATEAIALKIQGNLLQNLSPSIVGEMGLYFHWFPEDENIRTTVNLFDEAFYPDIAEQASARRMSCFFKRIMDVFGSIVAMIIFSPFFLIIPVIIKLTSEGPIIFRQERIGQFGSKFIFLKFRSMYINNDDSIHREYIKKLITENKFSEEGSAGNGPVYKIKGDPRVTSIGRYLRKTSLDELPQFFNVLRGEMSLVGPRPAIPYELDSYDMWHRHRLLQVKPGITGLWQVKGRSSTTFDDMVRLDLKYIREWSLWLDIKLLFLTPLAVFKGKGAY